MLNDFYSAVLKDFVIQAALLIVVPFLVGLMIKAFQRVGLSIDDKRREMIHKAAEAATLFALARVGGGLSGLATGPIMQSVINDAIGYLKTKNPKIVKKLKMSEKDMADIVTSKIGKLQNER